MGRDNTVNQLEESLGKVVDVITRCPRDTPTKMLNVGILGDCYLFIHSMNEDVSGNRTYVGINAFPGEVSYNKEKNLYELDVHTNPRELRDVNEDQVKLWEDRDK